MTKRRILICDDSPDVSKDWKTKLDDITEVARHFKTDICAPADITKLAEQLDDRRRVARSGNVWSGTHDFDSLDVLIVDYDLQDQDPRSGREIAYLARCFSTCGLIVLLNEHGSNPFDLTLSGFTDSFADLNIGGRQIASTGLWKQPWIGFRPWAWPLIPTALVDLEHRAKSLATKLDESIFTFLGLDPIFAHFSRPLIEFLSAGTTPAEKITFREFLRKCPNGLQYKDREAVLSDQQLARIAAARISHWLERLVLPGQHILVDAPHLVSRFPTLLDAKTSTMRTLNETAHFAKPSESGVKSRMVSDHLFTADSWLSRAAWIWPSLSKDETIDEVKNPWESEDTGFVFCEDVSSFVPKEDTREFIADVPSSFVKRYIVAAGSKSKDAKLLSKAVQDVSYLPSARLAY